jgi:ATP-binding protein involved in chromosome partitioning
MPPVDAVRAMVPADYGVEMMSGSRPARQPIIFAADAQSAIRQFLMDVRGDLDYLVVDLPPGTGDAALSLAQAVPLTGAVIVTTPQQVARMDVVRSIEMFKKLDVPILGIVENMSYFPQPDGQKVYMFGQGGGRRRGGTTPLLGGSRSPTRSAGGDSGRPIV